MVHGAAAEEWGASRRAAPDPGPPRGGRLDRTAPLTILDRQFFRELTQNLVFTLVVLTAIALFSVSGHVFYRYHVSGVLLFLTLVKFTLIQVLTFLLPLSLLVSVVFVYGRAASDHEVTTLKASGIHPFRILWPGLLLALGLCAITLEVENRWAPWALHQLNVLPEDDETIRTLLERRLKDGGNSIDFGDSQKRPCTLTWEVYHAVGGGGVEFENVLFERTNLREPGDPRPAVVDRVRAPRALFRIDELGDVFAIRFEKPVGLTGEIAGAEQDALTVTIRREADLHRTRLKLQTLPELYALAARGRETSDLSGSPLPLLRRYDLVEVEGRIQQHLSRAAAPIVFLLLGMPLALIFRSGNKMIAFLLATLVGMFVYYPLERLGNVLMSRSLVSPFVACWSGNFLLAAIGLSLLVFVVRR